jgi:hypothetical protein
MSFSKGEIAVISAFRKRWAALKRKAAAGTLGEYRNGVAGCFQAANDQDCAALAAAYYGEKHVREMCGLSDSQIVANLCPVCQHLDETVENEDGEPDDAANAGELLASEYVLFSYPDDVPARTVPLEIIDLCRTPDEFDPEGGDDGWTVDFVSMQVEAYTSNEACNDDWSERVGGFSTFFLGVLMKSTGEPFLESETRMVMECVVQNVSGNDQEELWVFEFAHNGNQMIVRIDTDEGDVYVEPLRDAILAMEAPAVSALVHHISGMAEDDRSALPEGLLAAVTAYSQKKQPKADAFKNKLARLLAKQKAAELRALEEELRPFLFGGRPYYRSPGGGIEFFSGR